MSRSRTATAEEEITTGSEARCFAQYMRIHALESSDGLTYAQMGRFVAAADPNDPAGTSDEAAAAKDPEGDLGDETALSTALNVSYMASQIALFSIVVGIALLLAGIGFVILALAVFGTRGASAPAAD